jgi:uncharacterized protein with PQ loop repeat
MTDFIKDFLPGIGVLTANFIYFSSLTEILYLKRNFFQKPHILKDNNPLPYSTMSANTSAWMFYGMLSKNLYVYAANIFGLMLSIFYTVTVYSLWNFVEKDKTFSSKLESKSFQILFVWIGLTFFVWTCGFYAFYYNTEIDGVLYGQDFMGKICIVFLILFLGSPLSGIYNVIVNKNASSINFYMAGTILFNSLFWLGYGITIKDMYQIVPNSIGLILSVVQLFLKLLFSSNSYEKPVGDFDKDVMYRKKITTEFKGI